MSLLDTSSIEAHHSNWKLNIMGTGFQRHDHRYYHDMNTLSLWKLRYQTLWHHEDEIDEHKDSKTVESLILRMAQV